LDLYGRFTKTTELQTSALAALWKMVKTLNLRRSLPPFPALFENDSSEKFETFRADRPRCVE